MNDGHTYGIDSKNAEIPEGTNAPNQILLDLVNIIK